VCVCVYVNGLSNACVCVYVNYIPGSPTRGRQRAPNYIKWPPVGVDISYPPSFHRTCLAPSIDCATPYWAMAKDYHQLWKDAISAGDKAKAIQTLSDVLVEKEGRVFFSRLDGKEAKLCVEILDDVSCDPHSSHSPLPQTNSLGRYRTQPQTYQEACSIYHL